MISVITTTSSSLFRRVLAFALLGIAADVSARSAQVCPGPELPPVGCFSIDTSVIGGRAFDDFVVTQPGKLLVDTGRRRAELAAFDPDVSGRLCAVNTLVMEAVNLPTFSFRAASVRFWETRWTVNGVGHVREYARVAFDTLQSSDGAVYARFGLTFNREQGDPTLRLEFFPTDDPNLAGIAGLGGDVYLNVNTATGDTRFQRPDDLSLPLRRVVLGLAQQLETVFSSATEVVVVPGAVGPLWNVQGVAQAGANFSALAFGTPLPTFPPIVTFNCNLLDAPGTVVGCAEDLELNRFRDFMIRYGADYLARGDAAVATVIVSNLRSWSQANALSVFPGLEPGQINQPDFRPKYNLQWVLVPIVHTWSLVRLDPLVTTADRDLIDGWFARVVAFSTEPNGGPQNPENPFNVGYLVRGLKMAWGIIAGNNVAVAEGMEKVLMGLNQMRADGSFPREVARGACALKYQDTMLLNLLFIAELAATQGYNAYALSVDGKSLHTAVQFLLDAVDDPAVVLRYATQDPTNCSNEPPLPTIGLSTVVDIGANGQNYSAWLEPYIARFPDHPNSSRLRNLLRGGLAASRPIMHPHAGGNTSCLSAEATIGPIKAGGLGTVVIEYLNTADFPNSPGGHYFYSSDLAERAAVDAGAAGRFVRTGRQFFTGGSAPVCRFYGSMTPGPNSHFFTVDTDECNALKAAQVKPPPATTQQWNFEGVSYSTTPPSLLLNGERSCPSETRPLYRAYNDAFPVVGSKNAWDSNHRFTPRLSDIADMIASGWRDEGIVFCTAQ